MAPKIIVVPPSDETGEIAREMAPAGFELVLARSGADEASTMNVPEKQDSSSLPVGGNLNKDHTRGARTDQICRVDGSPMVD